MHYFISLCGASAVQVPCESVVAIETVTFKAFKCKTLVCNLNHSKAGLEAGLSRKSFHSKDANELKRNVLQ